MKKSLLLLVLFFICLKIVIPSVEITEVMYNPADGEEWIEFYFSGDETLNISELTLIDNYQTDNIVCCDSDPGCSFLVKDGFFLILEKDASLFFNNSFCVDDSAIGNGLGNSQDIILLYNTNEILVNFSYNISTDKGLSLSFVNNTWLILPPTPGIENSIPEAEEIKEEDCLELEIILPEQPYSTIEYNAPFKAINNCRKENKTEATIYYNISLLYNDTINLVSCGTSDVSINHYTTANTGKIIFPEEGIYELCGCILGYLSEEEDCVWICNVMNVSDPKKISCNISLSVWTEKKIYDKEEKVPLLFTISNSSFPFEIEYWIEDVFGEVVKSSYKTKNTNKKSFSPSFDEVEKAFVIKANLSFIACNNSGDGFSEELFVMCSERKNESYIEIKKILLPDKSSISFGDVAKITFYVYKGNTRKYSISVFAGKENKKISEITTLNVPGQFNEHELTVPVMLKENCNKRYAEGKYYIYVEGLGSEDKKEILVKENFCKTSVPELQETGALHELLFTKSNNKDIESILQIYNPDSKTHIFSVWSYLYRGSASYSGEREENIVQLEVPPASYRRVILQNTFTGKEEGQYGLKIKVQRDDRKTADEITKNVSIGFPTKAIAIEPEEKKLVANASELNNSLQKAMPLTGKVAYVSSSEKAKNFLPFILAMTLILILVAWIRLRRS